MCSIKSESYSSERAYIVAAMYVAFLMDTFSEINISLDNVKNRKEEEKSQGGYSQLATVASCILFCVLAYCGMYYML